MSRTVKVSEEVYDAIQILKVHSSTSNSDIIKGVIDIAFPGDFFDTDSIDRVLFREETGLIDVSRSELRQMMREKRRRNSTYENTDSDE